MSTGIATVLFSLFLLYRHLLSQRQDDFANGLPKDRHGINGLWRVFPLLWDDPVL